VLLWILKSAGFRECAIAQVQGKKGEQGSGGVVVWWILCIVMLCCYAYNRLAVKLLKQQEQLIILSCVTMYTMCHLLATLLVNEEKMVDSG